MRYVYRKKAYKILFSVVDTLGWIVSCPRVLFRRSGDIYPKKLLIIRLDHIGDVVGATAVLAPLRKYFPGTSVHMMVPSCAEELIAPLPYVDRAVKFDAPWFRRGGHSGEGWFSGVKHMAALIKAGDYDTVIDLRGDFRHILAIFLAGVKNRIGYGITGGGFLLTNCVPCEGVEHETFRALKLLGPLGIHAGPSPTEVPVTSAYRENAAALKKDLGIGGRYAVIHPVPGHSSKNWKTGYFSDLIVGISRMGMTPVIIGASGDREIVYNIIERSGVEAKDIAGKTSLGTMAAIMAGAEVFVGVDSGPAHISAALCTPTVIIFGGANDPDQWAPKGDNVKVLYPGRDKDLSLVTPEDVLRAVEEVSCKLK